MKEHSLQPYLFLLALVREEDIDTLEYLYLGVQERYEQYAENAPGDLEKYLHYYPVHLRCARLLAEQWVDRYPASYAAHLLLAGCLLWEARARRGAMPVHMLSPYNLELVKEKKDRALALINRARSLSGRPFHAWLLLAEAAPGTADSGMPQWYRQAEQLEPASLSLRIAYLDMLAKAQPSPPFDRMEAYVRLPHTMLTEAARRELQAVYHHHYAQYRRQEEGMAEAEQHLSIAYSLCPARGAAWLARFYQHTRAAGKASRYFREALAAGPENAALLYDYARWLWHNGAGAARAMACYRRAARMGHSAAWVRLGDIYREGGNGHPRHILKAVSYYQLAYRTGDTEAAQRLADIYWRGDETESALKDRAKALDILDQLARDGNGWACARLAALHLDGAVPYPDLALAWHYLTLGLQYGSMHCYYLIGKRIYEGRLLCKSTGILPGHFRPTRNDRRTAIDYLLQSASLGYVKAMACLARYFDKGHEEDRNPVAAAEWYCRTADHDLRDEEGCCWPAFRAVFYGEYKDRNLPAAARYLHQGAAVNGASCQHRLAWELLKGNFAYDANGKLQPHTGPANERNRRIALQLYEKAAAAGHLDAMYQLALYHKQHAAGREDHLTAFRYFLQAAEAGKAGAQKEVGRYYLNGLAVERNEAHAGFWLGMAADASRLLEQGEE